jgi:uncharacterized membrane protein
MLPYGLSPEFGHFSIEQNRGLSVPSAFAPGQGPHLSMAGFLNERRQNAFTSGFMGVLVAAVD